MIIYVSNLSPEVTEEELQQEFEAFGEVASVSIMRDKHSEQSRGLGFVEMLSQSEGEAAITGVNGKTLHGQTLDVNETPPHFDNRGRGFYGDRRGGKFGRPRHAFQWFTATPGVLSAAPDLQNFVKSLTDANAADIEKYMAEITANEEFHEHLGENRGNFGGRGWGISTSLGTVLYAICRKAKPDTVVETGVSSGVSSAYILCALEENKHGELYSIDLPWEGTGTYSRRYFAPEGVASGSPEETQSGWIIPNYLRHRWQLELGRSSEKLPPLLEKLGAIDIFFHDSEHSYQNMLWEYQTAWEYLKGGGILLSHNVDSNDAFPDFCQSVKVKGFLLSNMGGTVKA